VHCEHGITHIVDQVPDDRPDRRYLDLLTGSAGETVTELSQRLQAHHSRLRGPFQMDVAELTLRYHFPSQPPARRGPGRSSVGARPGRRVFQIPPVNEAVTDLTTVGRTARSGSCQQSPGMS
jgi:hypothetical protein